MGAQTIGLDIGTHAVRAVELSRGRGTPAIVRTGQVALPPGAVEAGEVVDPGAVSRALRRLWSEVGFKSRTVVVGVANARVVARLAELPSLPDEELRSSLRYQVQDLIPLPIDEAHLDFQVLERIVTDEGEERARLLLVAGHRAMLESLLVAVEGAGLSLQRIDLVPFALVRAVHDELEWLRSEESGGQEVVVGVGAGLTNVVVHDQGVPRFVRSLPTAGAAVTAALAEELGIETSEAEARKRSLSGHEGSLERSVAEAAIGPLADDIAGSLDFHFAQAASTEVRRVLLTGGGARLSVLRDLLADQLGVTVEAPAPYGGLDTSKVGIAPEVVAQSADAFTVAVGLALTPLDATERPPINLLPVRVARARTERRQRALVGAGVVAFAAVLGGLSLVRSSSVDAARIEASEAEDRRASLEAQVGALQEVETLQASITKGGGMVSASLAGDIEWSSVINGIAKVLPHDVWLTSLSVQSEPGLIDGTIELTATGADHTSTARWLQRAAGLDALANTWVTSSTKGELEGESTVQISSNAQLGQGAVANRTGRYGGDSR